MQKQSFFSTKDIIFENFEINSKESVVYDEQIVELPRETMPFLHYHNRLEIGICIDGVGIFYGRNTTEGVKPDDIVIFFPGKAHYSQSVDIPCRCRFAYIDSKALLFSLFQEDRRVYEMLTDAFKKEVPAVIRRNEYPGIHNLLKIMLEDIFSEIKHSELITALHLSELLLKISQIFPEVEQQEREQLQEGDVISLVEAFICTHYSENITADILCNISFLSESQMRRRFKKVYGLSPMRYLRKLRTKIASRLLVHTDLSIAVIAQKVGYGDVSEFYRHFVAEFDMAPSLYRRQSK